MSWFEDAGAGECENEGESLEGAGVTLVESREAAVATGRAELLKTEDAELACEVEDPPVLVMSPGEDSSSST